VQKFLILIVVVCLNCDSLFGQWIQTNFSVNSPVLITDVAVTENYLFVSTSEGSVYRTSDYGNNWNEVNNGLSASYISKLYYEADASSNEFYAAADSGLFLTTDFGENWFNITNNLTNKYIISVYKTDNYLFSSTGNSIEYRSTNNGVDWNEISIGSSGQRVNSFLKFGNTIFAGLSLTGNSVYKSEDFGLTWSVSDNGLSSEVTTLEKLGNRIFASFYGFVYQSTDSGNNWMPITKGILQGYPLPDMKAFGDYLFIASLSGVYTIHTSKDSAQVITGNLPGVPLPLTDNIDVNEDHIIVSFNNLSTSTSEVWIRPTSSVTSSEETIPSIPNDFSLSQNYPNPFNPTTKIKYTIPSNVRGEMSSVLLKVYDVLGNEVATLINEVKPSGSYEVEFKAGELSSGIYLYKLVIGSSVLTKKMILIK